MANEEDDPIIQEVKVLCGINGSMCSFFCAIQLLFYCSNYNFDESISAIHEAEMVSYLLLKTSSCTPIRDFLKGLFHPRQYPGVPFTLRMNSCTRGMSKGEPVGFDRSVSEGT